MDYKTKALLRPAVTSALKVMRCEWQPHRGTGTASVRADRDSQAKAPEEEGAGRLGRRKRAEAAGQSKQREKWAGRRHCQCLVHHPTPGDSLRAASRVLRATKRFLGRDPRHLMPLFPAVTLETGLMDVRDEHGAGSSPAADMPLHLDGPRQRSKLERSGMAGGRGTGRKARGASEKSQDTPPVAGEEAPGHYGKGGHLGQGRTQVLFWSL